MMKSKNIARVREEVKRIGETLAAQVEKSNHISVGIRMTPDLHQRVKIAAAQQNKRLSALITIALERYLAESEKNVKD